MKEEKEMSYILCELFFLQSDGKIEFLKWATKQCYKKKVAQLFSMFLNFLFMFNKIVWCNDFVKSPSPYYTTYISRYTYTI